MSQVRAVDVELLCAAVKRDEAGVWVEQYPVQGVLDSLHVLSIEASARVESCPGERSTSDLVVNVCNLASYDRFDCEAMD